MPKPYNKLYFIVWNKGDWVRNVLLHYILMPTLSRTLRQANDEFISIISAAKLDTLHVMFALEHLKYNSSHSLRFLLHYQHLHNFRVFIC